jgi:hypothetical protein
MNAKFSFLSLLLIVLFSTQISLANETVTMLARKAVSENAAEATAAIEELRELGPAGLEALLTQHAGEIDRHIADPKLGPGPEWQRITHALDLVGQQKNNFISGLYWYTDFEDAKKAARESGKPILSLRLLGNLTDELSCANSRFFRSVLYPNAQIRDVLRERFVLHWKSVRPAPRITIDFGDGRKLERTVTGNSIHYVLDTDGQLIEAIPGLYGPTMFRSSLEAAGLLFKSLAGKAGAERNALLVKYYFERANKISLQWVKDTQRIGGSVPREFQIIKDQNGGEALAIAPLAVTKAAVEVPALRAINTASEMLGRVTNEQAWKNIAFLHHGDGMLDNRSIALIKRQNQSLSDNDLSRLLHKFQESVALDTVRNEYMMRARLYGWMVQAASRADLEKFNEQVYANLFLTPGSDPWLGLLSTDVYAAIDNGGVIKGGR